MEFLIFCTIGNSIFNIFIAIFHYKTCFKFEDLGRIEVPISIRGRIGRRKKVYLMDFIIEQQPLMMAISEADYERLNSHDRTEIYARKFPSKFNSYVTIYDVALQKTDWVKKDCAIMWKQFLFFFPIFEFFIICIAFQL